MKRLIKTCFKLAAIGNHNVCTPNIQSRQSQLTGIIRLLNLVVARRRWHVFYRD
jgi:hypothetical protein